MNRFLAAIAALAVLPLMCLGVGSLVVRFCRAPNIRPAFFPAIGIAALVGVGGLLNLFRLVDQWTILACVVIGLMGAGWEIRGWRRCSFWSAVAKPSSLLVAAIVAFVVLTQLPPAVFNYGDDFAKYFSHPLRMLETGTIYGSPLSAAGMETLGGQAFLQCFFAACFPIEYINGADAVLGLFLCLILAQAICGETRWLAWLGVASVFVIEPQYVNVSSIYLGALLVMAATALGNEKEPPIALLSLLYAASVALKSTFLVFVVAHSLVVAARVTGWRPRAFFTAITATAGWLLPLAPWVLVHLPSYLNWGPPSGGDLGSDAFIVSVWSFYPLPYGGSMANYWLVVLALFWGASLRCIPIGDRGGRSFVPMLLVGALALTYTVFLFVMGPLSGYQFCLRFFVPVLIGMAPPILELTAIPPHPSPLWLRISPTIVALLLFFPARWQRWNETVSSRSALPFSFASGETYQAYNRFILDGVAEQALRAAQESVPPGEAILASVRCSFLLNFKRNPIADMDAAGLANPWAKVPKVNYVLMQNPGYGSRTEADLFASGRLSPGARERLVHRRALAMLRYLADVSKQGTLIYSGDGFRVYRVQNLPSRF